MTRNACRTARLCDHIDEAGAALIAAMERTCEALTGEPVTANQRRAIFAAFRDCRRTLRIVALDGAEINAGAALIKALAHTFELTPDVARKKRQMSEDLVQLRKITFIKNLEDLFPEEAA